jgi:hypothetical protein
VLATGASADLLAGLVYAASYFAAVLLAPPLLLAALLIAITRWMWPQGQAVGE